MLKNGTKAISVRAHSTNTSRLSPGLLTRGEAGASPTDRVTPLLVGAEGWIRCQLAVTAVSSIRKFVASEESSVPVNLIVTVLPM